MIAAMVVVRALQRPAALLAVCAAWLGGCATGPSLSAPPLPRADAEAALLALRGRALMVPVLGVWPQQVSDTYNAPRDGGRRHEASDIPAPRDTPVLAADDGQVVRVGWNRRGGNMIYAVDKSGGLVYYYAHLEGHAAGLRAGQPLRRGDLLGYVGTSGNAPAGSPHLHFQVMLRRADGSIYGGPPLDARPLFALPGALTPATSADPPLVSEACCAGALPLP